MPKVEERTRVWTHIRLGDFAGGLAGDVFEKACTKGVVEICGVRTVAWLNVRFDECKKFCHRGSGEFGRVIAKEDAEFGAHAVKRRIAVIVAIVVAVRIPL